MPIQITRSRRGLYSLEEYAVYRGKYIPEDPQDPVLPLPDSYEPIIYMKCLVNGHQFPIRPEIGEIWQSYTNFMERDLIANPYECPRCHETSLVFKWCELEDQPRTFNDSNHRFITKHRERITNPASPVFEYDGFLGIARPHYEDYFPHGHTNHNDPFSEEIVNESSRRPEFYSETLQIAQSLPIQQAIPRTNMYDPKGLLLATEGQYLKELPGVDRETGKYTKVRKNYDFYRAIVRIIVQIDRQA